MNAYVTTQTSPLELMAMRDQLGAEQDRQKAITNRWKFYEGQHPKPLKVEKGNPDDNVIANFARFVVDQGVSFLFGDDLKFDLDESIRERSPEEEYLDSVWDANEKMTTLYELGMNGGVAGHAFLKLVLDPDMPDTPRLLVLDPTNVTVQCDPHDMRKVTRYRIQYPITGDDGKPKTFRQTIKRAGSQLWTIVDEEANIDAYDWRQVGPTVLWSYDFPPVVDCQNLIMPNRYWGLSDLEDDVTGLNQAMNFLLSNNQRVLKHYADPKTVAKGVTLDQIKRTIGGIFCIPGGSADSPTDLYNLEMQSDGTFSIEQLKRIKELLHQTSEMPEVAAGKLESVGQLSGVALAILYGPIVKKTGRKRFTYGRLFSETNRRLLVMKGVGEGLKTMIRWPEIVPGDPTTKLQAGLLKEQVGFSKDTVISELGGDPEKEAEKRKKEAESAANVGQQMLGAFDKGGQVPEE